MQVRVPAPRIWGNRQRCVKAPALNMIWKGSHRIFQGKRANQMQIPLQRHTASREQPYFDCDRCMGDEASQPCGNMRALSLLDTSGSEEFTDRTPQLHFAVEITSNLMTSSVYSLHGDDRGHHTRLLPRTPFPGGLKLRHVSFWSWGLADKIVEFAATYPNDKINQLMTQSLHGVTNHELVTRFNGKVPFPDYAIDDRSGLKDAKVRDPCNASLDRAFNRGRCGCCRRCSSHCDRLWSLRGIHPSCS